MDISNFAFWGNCFRIRFAVCTPGRLSFLFSISLLSSRPRTGSATAFCFGARLQLGVYPVHRTFDVVTFSGEDAETFSVRGSANVLAKVAKSPLELYLFCVVRKTFSVLRSTFSVLRSTFFVYKVPFLGSIFRSTFSVIRSTFCTFSGTYILEVRF